ncbi:MAG: NTP transferase domain-containing protein [Planctomycetota bacterium]
MNAKADDKLAVILAAGRGIRLRPFTDHTPKALALVAGRTILTHILEALASGAGVRRFVVVVGYRTDAFADIQAPAGCKLELVENDQWEISNSMFSLSLCAHLLANGGYIVEGDCCFDRHLLAAGNGRNDTALWFVRPFGAEDDGCCLRADAAGLIHTLSIEKTDAFSSNGWKSCGVLRLTPTLGRKLNDWLSAAVSAGRQKEYFDLILADHLREANLYVADIGRAPWWEVDNETDLQRAERIFRTNAS